MWRDSLPTKFMVQTTLRSDSQIYNNTMTNNKIDLYLIIQCNNCFQCSVVLPILFMNKGQQQNACCPAQVHW